MRIAVIAVGKIKEDYLKRAIDDYVKRSSRYSKISIHEVAEEDIGRYPVEQVKAREAEQLLKKVQEVNPSYVIALDREGEPLSSPEFATRLESLMVEGRSSVVFIIGGALGLDKSVLSQAHLKLSFSEFTFTHQMIRLLLLEQIYRAFKIIKNEPYHY